MTLRDEIDTAPDDTVYRVPGNSNDGPTIFHATRDCDRLTRARHIQPKPLGVLFDDAQPCPWCHDALETPRAGPNAPTLANTYPDGVEEDTDA